MLKRGGFKSKKSRTPVILTIWCPTFGYLQLILADTEAARAAAISLQNKLVYLRKSESAYISLKIDHGSAKINLHLVVTCVDLWHAADHSGSMI